MKLQILQESFSKALLVATRFTSSRAQLPVLSNIYLKAKGSTLQISSTNLETSFSTSIGAKIEKEGEITVPARTFLEIISNLNDGPINLSCQKEVVRIKTSNFSSSISGMNSSEFPSIPHSLSKTSINIKKDDFIEVVKKIVFSISTDETRPVLTGALFSFKKDSLVFVSTDGFRLTKKTLKIKSTKEFLGKNILLPKNILSEIPRLSDSEEIIGFSYREKDNQVVFKVGNSYYSSRVLGGTFPDYQKVIPKDSKFVVSMGKDDLLQGIKLSSVFARDVSNMIKLEISKGGSLVVSSESNQKGGQESKIDIKFEEGNKEDLRIGFNYKFIEEVLQIIESETVTISFVDENSPGVFKCLEDKDFLHLIMPVKLD